MPYIHLETLIKAPIERCFDLSRSIDLHSTSVRQTGEKAIAGTTTGLIGPGETVTWRARHFGVRQNLTSKITGFEYPTYFCDEMVKGAFQRMRHEHHFRHQSNITVMTDLFEFESPFGRLGRMVNQLVLTEYMKRFLLQRNAAIKRVAESDQWKQFLPQTATPGPASPATRPSGDTPLFNRPLL
jgi:ligand-binding SRPBCC domain-containing protein